MATEWYLCCEYFSWIAVCSRPTRLAFRWKLCSAPAHSLNSLALQRMQCSQSVPLLQDAQVPVLMIPGKTSTDYRSL